MSFTVDFILLFILVVIPGLLFKRFFFFGEFSKQYTTKESIYKSIFYSIIPGIVIQLFSYWLYSVIRDPWFSTEDVLTIFKELFSIKSNYSASTKRFFDEGFNLFLLHELNVFFLAALIGLVFSRLIRLFKWDIHFKIFRFQNQWYYVFSGEIRTFRKFKHLKNILGEIDGLDHQTKQTEFPPYGDILVQNGGDQNLYTGFIVDYDLDYENLNDLDRIYLMGASRYREIREGEDTTKLDVRGSRIKVPIKGDVFILDAKSILNINLTFLPTRKQEKPKSETWPKFKRAIYYFGIIINLSILIYFIFINSFLFKSIFPELTEFLKGYGILWRILAAFTVTQAVAFFIPAEIKPQTPVPDQTSEELSLEFEDELIELSSLKSTQIKTYSYSWSDIGWKLLFAGIFGVSSYFAFLY